MIVFSDYNFAFASPPRTGTTWFLKALSHAGMGEITNKTIVHAPPTSKGQFVLSIVRHPYDWLESLYYALKGGKIGVPEVDVFADWIRDSLTFRYFIESYVVTNPGCVKTAFDAYKPSSVIRLEDFPWSALEFLEIHAKPDKLNYALSMPPQNARKVSHAQQADLRIKIVHSESEFCDHYDYW